MLFNIVVYFIIISNICNRVEYKKYNMAIENFGQ